jgi:hypothetical protein
MISLCTRRRRLQIQPLDQSPLLSTVPYKITKILEGNGALVPYAERVLPALDKVFD